MPLVVDGSAVTVGVKIKAWAMSFVGTYGAVGRGL